ncbi:unnamed protein product, partial [Nesidiocoris tenuis]
IIVNPPQIDELFVRPLFRNTTSVDDSDDICVLNGRKPMSHYDASSTQPCTVKRILHNL